MAIVFKTPISALNTTTKDIQNIKQGDCPPCPEPVVESTSEEYTSNGEYTLTPKEGVDGFSQVEITVNVPSDVNNQNKDVTISQNGEQTISADSGYTGLGEVSVTVAVDVETPYNEGYAAGETAGIATGKAEGIAEQKAKLTSTTITENGTTTREDGWNSVTVNVDVTTPYNNGVADGEAAQKAKLTSGTFVSNGTYTREDGYNSVTVNVPSDINNQDKTVDPSTSQQTVSADNGYSGLGQVTVNAVTASIDRNIQPENIVKGVSILGVTGDVFVPTLEEGTYAPEFIGTTTVEPRIEGNGFSSVEITVPTQPIGSTNNPFDNIQAVLDIDFEEGYYYDDIASGEINKTTGYYDAVANEGTVFHIKPYLNNPDYDPELRPEDQPDVPEFIFPEDFDLAGKNIIVLFNKANVSQINNQTKAPLLRSAIIYEFNDCDLSAINYNFEPTTWPFGTLDVTENGTVDPTGYAEINVDVQPNLQTKSVTPSDRQQVITPDRDYDGLSEVTVSGVTAAIDQNITASNIKDGVTILGVTGTYDPQPSLESKTASYTANGTYTITPSTGYDGMSDVEVTVNVSGGSGTQCPDWSSIGWDCNDVAAAGIDADVAVTAALLENYDPTDNRSANMTYWANRTNMVYAPSIDVWEASNADNAITGFFQGDTKLTTLPNLKFVGYTDRIAGKYIQPYCSYMFKGCRSLQSVNLDLSSDDPQSSGYVRGATSMFEGCSSLISVSLINTNGLTTCGSMFKDCINLTNISLFNTSNVTIMYSMFSNCKSLQTIPLFDTSNVTSFSNIFYGCSALTAIPQFNTSNGIDFNQIFGNGWVDLHITEFPTWDLSKAQTIDNMFTNYITANSLTTLGGFTNLGKAFLSTGTAAQHLLNLSKLTRLTYQSIMNVINNLAAPDDTAVTDATIKLSAASYALLTEEDIAIATAKRWSVTSA